MSRKPTKRKRPKTLGATGRGRPYLWLRPARPGRNGSVRPEAWIIIDRGKQVGTGCGPGDEQGALAALAAYVTALDTPPEPEPSEVPPAPRPVEKNRAARDVPIAEVVLRYLQVKKDIARPKELGQRMTSILEWWGERSLADIDSVTCGAYVESRQGSAWKAHARMGSGKDGLPARRGHSRPTKQRTVGTGGARRELEDLRAAVNLAIADAITRDTIKVPLPPAGDDRKRWLTKEEAARLVAAAWRRREVQTIHRGPRTGEKVVTDNFSSRHLARFILVALRTGTRSSAICNASFIPEVGRPWVELKRDRKGRPHATFHRLALGTTEARNKRYPTVPLPDQLAAQLWRWHHVLGQRYVVEWRGKPVKSTQKAFANLAYELGFGDDVVRHSLRHTAATWGMQEGTPVAELAGYLGMTIETLERTYGHHSPNHMEHARDAMGGGKRKRRREAEGRAA